jgi:ElaB/YqjD/DUF883 family membrane-anchored ribosome-binding protein
MGKGAAAMTEYEKRDPELAGQAPDRSRARTDEADDLRPVEIEREIELTRERMSENIDELGNRLSPQNLKAQAKDAIHDAAANAVVNVSESARRTGDRLVDMIRENPLPVIAVGAAATWLLTRRSAQGPVSGDRMARYAYTGPERRYRSGEQQGGFTQRVGDTMGQARERMSDVASEVSERASEIGTKARQQTSRLKGTFEDTLEESPLAIAAGAVVLGLVVGLLLPRTERENEMMGPARDRLVSRAGDVAERVKDATVEAGREVVDTVQEELQERKPELESLARDVGQTVKEQVKSSAQRVKNEAKESVKGSGGSQSDTEDFAS